MTATMLPAASAGAVHDDVTALVVGPALATCSREQPPSCGAAVKAPGGKKTVRAKLAEWELAELSAQAEVHNERIADNEVAAVDDYWRLGRVLERVRGNFPRGTWQLWLDRRTIDRTRAKRARLLAEVFASLTDLKGLALHEALRIARLRKKARAADPPQKLERQLKSALNKLAAIAGELGEHDSPARFAALAQEVAAAAAGVCRACRA